MNKEELKKLTVAELKKEIEKQRKELFDLRMNIGTGEVRDYSQISKIRKNIARCLTFLKQKA